MLRVFLDSKEEASSSIKNNLNIQVLPLEKFCEDKKALERFNGLVNRYLSLNDKILIITMSSRISSSYAKLSNYFDNENVRVIDSDLSESCFNLIIKTIENYQNESMELIIDKIERLSEMINIFYYSILGR